MRELPGKVVRLYRVTCLGCRCQAEAAIGQGTKGTAEWSFRKFGWSKSRGGWLCYQCKKGK